MSDLHINALLEYHLQTSEAGYELMTFAVALDPAETLAEVAERIIPTRGDHYDEGATLTIRFVGIKEGNNGIPF